MFYEKREKLINKIEEAIEKETLQNINQDYIIKNYQNQKNGIYFLYDNDNIVIYVGMVGNGPDTSFAHRMYGHGSGAHDKQIWFSEATKFKFKCFQKLNKKQLLQVERLMICAKRPKYNDCYVTEDDINTISKNID